MPAIWETWVRSLGQEDPREKEMATHSIFLPGEFHGQRSLGATCVQVVTKSWTRLSNYHKLVSYLSFFFPIVNQGIFL